MSDDLIIEKILITVRNCYRFKDKSNSQLRLMIKLCIELHLWLESEEGMQWLKSRNFKKWLKENPGSVANWIENHKNDYIKAST